MARDRDHARRDVLEVADDDPRICHVDREPRLDRIPDPGGDEALHRAVVVRAERVARLDAGGAEDCLDRVARAVRLEPDQPLGADLGERRRLRRRGERGARRDDEDVGIVDELARLERRVRDRERDEPDVELAALDRQLDLLVVELADLDVDPGPRGGEAAHHGGEEAGAGGLEGADAQRPDLSRLQRMQVGLRGLQARRRSSRRGGAAARPPR